MEAPARKRGRPAKKAAAAAQNEEQNDADVAVAADEAAAKHVVEEVKAARGGGRKRAKTAEAHTGHFIPAITMILLRKHNHQYQPFSCRLNTLTYCEY